MITPITTGDPLPNRPVWDDAAALDLAALRGDVRADVCVVGLGGSGLSAVHELLSLGRSVVGVDAGAVGGAAAGRNGGFLLAGPADFHHDAVAKHGRERAVRLYRLTLEEIDRMAAETPGTVRRVGSIRLAASDEELADCRVQLDAMRADGLPAEWYEGPLGTGLRIPTDCAFQPMARARALARTVLDGGARLYERSPAIEIAGDAVRTPDGVVRCGAVVVAVDGALDLLLPELAPRIRSTRLQMLATAPTREVQVPCPVYARYGFDYWQQLPTAASRSAAAATSTWRPSGATTRRPRRPSRPRSTACCASAWACARRRSRTAGPRSSATPRTACRSSPRRGPACGRRARTAAPGTWSARCAGERRRGARPGGGPR
jgi:glycine/D-amino acid oxidase-like deaminating enzyme